jgi:hypothetical protein
MSYGNTKFAEIRKYIFGGEDKDGLTREEIRYVKLLLANFRTDPIGEAPLEIIVMIALQLDPWDFACCLRVSRAWRRRLLSDSIISAYGRYQWPAMIDSPTDRSSFLDILGKFQRASCHFLPLCKPGSRPHIFHIVRWDMAGNHQLDPLFHGQANTNPDTSPRIYVSLNNDARPPPTLYAFGKLVYSFCDCAVIDDLRLKTRKIFQPRSSSHTHGSILILKALGCKLIVATVGRVLFAWNHIDDRSYEKLLPSRPVHCATRHDKVAAVLYGGDVVIWTPGLAAVQLNVLKLDYEPSIVLSEKCARSICPYVFFDGRNSTDLYVVSACSLRRNSKSMVSVAIHQFSAGDYVTSWSCKCEDLAMKEDSRAENFPLEVHEYEFDHSAIFICRKSARSRGLLDIAVFDKIERKFADLAQVSRWYWRSNIWRSNTWRPEDEGKMGDLDFAVRCHPQVYEVARLNEPPRHTNSTSLSAGLQ